MSKEKESCKKNCDCKEKEFQKERIDDKTTIETPKAQNKSEVEIKNFSDFIVKD